MREGNDADLERRILNRAARDDREDEATEHALQLLASQYRLRAALDAVERRFGATTRDAVERRFGDIVLGRFSRARL